MVAHEMLHDVYLNLPNQMKIKFIQEVRRIKQEIPWLDIDDYYGVTKSDYNSAGKLQFRKLIKRLLTEDIAVLLQNYEDLIYASELFSRVAASAMGLGHPTFFFEEDVYREFNPYLKEIKLRGSNPLNRLVRVKKITVSGFKKPTQKDISGDDFGKLLYRPTDFYSIHIPDTTFAHVGGRSEPEADWSMDQDAWMYENKPLFPNSEPEPVNETPIQTSL